MNWKEHEKKWLWSILIYHPNIFFERADETRSSPSRELNLDFPNKKDLF
jgi:hypothetical protein